MTGCAIQIVQVGPKSRAKCRALMGMLSQNENCTGCPKLWANFRALPGIFSQSVGPSLAIWANPVHFSFESGLRGAAITVMVVFCRSRAARPFWPSPPCGGALARRCGRLAAPAMRGTTGCRAACVCLESCSKANLSEKRPENGRNPTGFGLARPDFIRPSYVLGDIESICSRTAGHGGMQ